MTLLPCVLSPRRFGQIELSTSPGRGGRAAGSSKVKYVIYSKLRSIRTPSGGSRLDVLSTLKFLKSVELACAFLAGVLQMRRASLRVLNLSSTDRPS